MEKLIVCSLTQEPTYSPVICLKTGLIYDFQNIKRYLEKAQNECPSTKQILNFPKDFQKVQGLKGPTLNVRSSADRNTKALKIAENFYDAIQTAKNNKETIASLRDQLTASLKQQEASLRVIKKLTGQRDEARSGIIQYKNIQKKVKDLTEESGLMVQEVINDQVNQEDQEVKAIEYKTKPDEGDIIDQKYDYEALEVQDLIKSESFRLKDVRKELIKNQKQNQSYQYLQGNRDSDISLRVSAKIQGLSKNQYTPGNSTIVQHPFEKSYVLISSQQPVLVNFNLENEDGQQKATSVNVSIKSDTTTNSDRQYNKSSIADFSRFTHIRPYSLISDETTLGFFAVRNDGFITIGVISLEEDTYGVYTSCASFRLDETIICAVNHPVENIFVLLNDKRQISVFDVSKGRSVVTYTVEEDLEIKFLSIHPDGKLVALCGSNSQVHFLDLSSGNVVITFDCQTVSYF